MGFSNAVLSPDDSLRSLESLMEVQWAVLNSRYFGRLRRLRNEDARELLLDIAFGAAEQSNRLTEVVAAWRDAAPPGTAASATEDVLSLRDMLESWIEIKEGSVDIYREAAACAPTREIRDALMELAAQDAAHLGKLRAML